MRFLYFTLVIYIYTSTFPVSSKTTISFLNFTEDEAYYEKSLKQFFYDSYETDYSINVEDLNEIIYKCNKRLKLIELVQKGKFNYCLDETIFTLWAGAGQFNLYNEDSLGRELDLNGQTVYIGGQISFHYSLDTTILLEGKYWFMPSFTSDDLSAIENLRTSSYLEGKTLLQKRVYQTPFSARYGFYFSKTPVLKNNTQSMFLEDLDPRFNSLLTSGPMLGFKYSPNRDKKTSYSLKADVTMLIFQDNKFFNELSTSFNASAEFKWFYKRFLSFTSDLQYLNAYKEDNTQASVFIFGVGAQAHLF